MVYLQQPRGIIRRCRNDCFAYSSDILVVVVFASCYVFCAINLLVLQQVTRFGPWLPLGFLSEPFVYIVKHG
jgi:uncharacterized PurR-regulated membrane protein YhhQ (DUF165 family)